MSTQNAILLRARIEDRTLADNREAKERQWSRDQWSTYDYKIDNEEYKFPRRWFWEVYYFVK